MDDGSTLSEAGTNDLREGGPAIDPKKYLERARGDGASTRSPRRFPEAFSGTPEEFSGIRREIGFRRSKRTQCHCRQMPAYAIS